MPQINCYYEQLFVVGGWYTNSVEIFDSCCNKFVFLQQIPEGYSNYIQYISDVSSSGNKVVLFSNITGCVLFYDTENNEWSKKFCEGTKDIKHFSCVKFQKL